MAQKLATKKVIDEAKREHEEEMLKDLKRVYKAKLCEKSNAEKVLSNIDRELSEIELKMEHELGE